MTYSPPRRLRAVSPAILHGAFVLSQVPSRTRLLSSAVRQLAGLGRVAPVHVTFRADFPAAAIDSQAESELPGKAAEESAALYAYLTTLLGETDG